MHPKDAYGMANSVDPDQTLLQKQSDLGLHCLLRPICPNTQNLYGTSGQWVGFNERLCPIYD